MISRGSGAGLPFQFGIEEVSDKDTGIIVTGPRRRPTSARPLLRDALIFEVGMMDLNNTAGNHLPQNQPRPELVERLVGAGQIRLRVFTTSTTSKGQPPCRMTSDSLPQV